MKNEPIPLCDRCGKPRETGTRKYCRKCAKEKKNAKMRLIVTLEKNLLLD